MSAGQEDAVVHETVIVRRRRGHGDDGHHGGVWKIAYADFMTAMMAFFLVMWLINSTDQKTIVQVAAYFNPLRLTDKSAAAKGLHDGTEKPSAKQANTSPAGKATVASKPETDAAPKTKMEEKRAASREQDLLADPAKALSEIVQKSAKSEADRVILYPAVGPAESGPIAAGKLHDPFEPKFKRGDETRSDRQDQPRPPEKVTESGSVATAGKDAGARAIEKAIEQAIRVVAADMGVMLGPTVSIERTPEGLLISIADHGRFGMFAVASAEPAHELVSLLQKIGEVLKMQAGTIVVRGHTDGRPFRTAAYDNWRLSSARAYMAYHMLLRGGVDERRFERVEGHADRSPKNAVEKDAAENRRIEILLRLTGP
jgi:chemotaxis protein MotB